MSGRVTPPHRPLLMRAVNFAGARVPAQSHWLDPERLLRSAKRRAGLSDFGSREFVPRLELLADSLNGDAQLNFVGRVAARAHLVQLLTNRLRLVRDRARFPAISTQRIRAPVVITGLPRTGSTLLHGLLACDPEIRTPATWEVMEPSPPPAGVDARRVARVRRALRWVDRLAPAFSGVHPLGATLPQECIAITTVDFVSLEFHTTFDVPEYQRWLRDRGASCAYDWHRKFLQHLQCGRAAARWVLKAPAHMASIDALLAAYPDAHIVQTHRDPLTVCASIANHGTILRGAFSDRVDPGGIAHEWSQYWADALDNALAFRDAHADVPWIDLDYDELVADPLCAVRRLYEELGMALSDPAASAMRNYLARDPAKKAPRHRYNLAQFGLDPDALSKRFALYCERFDLTPDHT